MNAALSTNAINSVTSPRNLASSLVDFPLINEGSVEATAADSSSFSQYTSTDFHERNVESQPVYGDDGHSQQTSSNIYQQRYRYDSTEEAGANGVHATHPSPHFDQKGSNTQHSRVEDVSSPYDDYQSSHATNKTTEVKESEDTDDPMQLKRKRVSEMTSDERVQWSRMQSRDHSRRSRLRRKQLENDLRVQIEQLQSFRTLIEDSYELVSIHSLDPSAVYLYANSVHFRALNHIPQELIDQPICELAHPDDAAELEKAIGIIRNEDDKPNVTLEWRMRTRENFSEENVASYKHVISSISLNQQGIVIFSMIKNDMFSHSFSLEALSLVAAGESEKASELLAGI